MHVFILAPVILGPGQISVIAKFTIDSSEFILGQVLSMEAGALVEMKRVVPASRQVLPYVWVSGVDLEEFETHVRADDSVKSLTALDYVDGEGRYRVQWNEDVESLVYGMAQVSYHPGGRGERAVAVPPPVRRPFRTGGLPQLLYRARHLVQPGAGLHADRRTDGWLLARPDIVTAEGADSGRQDGYFQVSRGTTLGEIGEELGITEQTASDNVRRGANKVSRKVLLEQSAADLSSR